MIVFFLQRNLFCSCYYSLWSLIDGEEFDVEDEGGAAWDAGLGEFAVAHLGGDIDFPSVADVHVLHGNDPALDEVAQPARQGHLATAAVESRSVDGLACVMGGNHAAGRGSVTRWSPSAKTL